MSIQTLNSKSGIPHEPHCCSDPELEFPQVSFDDFVIRQVLSRTQQKLVVLRQSL